MSLSRYHSGAWRTVTALSRYHSGAWRTITGAWVYSGGAWRKFLGSFLAADGIADVDDLQVGLTSIATLTLNADGTQSGDATGSWGTPTTTGAGSGYYVYVTVVGDALSAGTTGSWVQLNAARTWELTANVSPGNVVSKSATLTIKVSTTASDAGLQYTATVAMSATADDSGV